MLIVYGYEIQTSYAKNSALEKELVIIPVPGFKKTD